MSILSPSVQAALDAIAARANQQRTAFSLLLQKSDDIQNRYLAVRFRDGPDTIITLAEVRVFQDEYSQFRSVDLQAWQLEMLQIESDVGLEPRGTLPVSGFLTSAARAERTKVIQTILDVGRLYSVQNLSGIAAFADSINSEAIRLVREENEQPGGTSAPEDIVSYRAEQNSDGSGPGDTGTWYVVGDSGEIDSSGLTEQAARSRAAALSADDIGDDDAEQPIFTPGAQIDETRFRAVFNDGTGPGVQGTYYVLGPGGQLGPSRNLTLGEAEAEAARLNAEIDREEAEAAAEAAITPAQREADRVAALTAQLREQASRAQQRKQANEGDWRVKLRLAESADYLYRDPDLREDGLLWPLAVTNGVIFPYTPTITTSYTANYTDQALTHSNYKGYFYQSSSVGQISISATFTAQDTSEADYMLAVIHFFRSATKMFYGQDAQRGAPPPLVFLQGLGEMQFNLHPCVINSFDYTLPANVDYIRARTANIPGNGDNLLFRRSRNSNPSSRDPSSGRLESAGLAKGARTALSPGLSTTLGRGTAAQGPSYVPTKMEILLTLLPIQTRLQQSQEFSVRQFANGSLQKGGFW